MKEVSESLEDYLEEIYQICETRQVARVKEIAEKMQVSTASVVGALRALRRKGLAHQERYGYIRLTKAGREVAENVFGRHQALTKFFHEILGIPLRRAEEEACRAEHSLGAETVERMILLKEFMETRGRLKENCIDMYRKFLKEKEK